jgi:hypothetical protein
LTGCDQAGGNGVKMNPELSEIIMEINDLQKTPLDNQPLAQTVLEINDLREFAAVSI